MNNLLITKRALRLYEMNWDYYNHELMYEYIKAAHHEDNYESLMVESVIDDGDKVIVIMKSDDFDIRWRDGP